MKFYITLLVSRNLDQLIDLSNRYIFHGDLEKIIEVTYSYRELEDGNILNETLFEEYLGLSYSEYDIEYLGRRYRYKIRVQIVLIDDILKKLQKIQVCSRAESLRRGIFIESLEYVKNILEISVLAVPFEMEKAGYKHRLIKSKIQKIIKDIEKKEKLAFGRKVIEKTSEFSSCYNFIVRNHETKKASLSRQDTKNMKKYLETIKQSAKCELIETPKLSKKQLRASFLKIEIHRKDYRKIFDAVCELYSLPQRTKITNAGSIYDGDEYLEIPRAESHSQMPMERLLLLLSHEIESHYINSYNGRILLGSFRGARNLEKEEGLAKFMEKIFLGYSHENMDNITEDFFGILGGEVLKGEDYKDFLKIMIKEYKCKKSFKSALYRIKRNYSFVEKGVQHKDVAYFRGLIKITAYIRNGGCFYKLFLGKVGFQDLENVSNLYAMSENKNQLVFPVFISDLIYYYFSNKEKDINFELNMSEYYLYLKKKYWFLDLERFGIIPFVEKNKKKIRSILSLLEKLLFK